MRITTLGQRDALPLRMLKFAQPELLTSSNQTISNVPFGTSAAPVTSTIITPIARTASVA